MIIYRLFPSPSICFGFTKKTTNQNNWSLAEERTTGILSSNQRHRIPFNLRNCVLYVFHLRNLKIDRYLLTMFILYPD